MAITQHNPPMPSRASSGCMIGLAYFYFLGVIGCLLVSTLITDISGAAQVMLHNPEKQTAISWVETSLWRTPYSIARAVAWTPSGLDLHAWGAVGVIGAIGGTGHTYIYHAPELCFWLGCVNAILLTMILWYWVSKGSTTTVLRRMLIGIMLAILVLLALTVPSAIALPLGSVHWGEDIPIQMNRTWERFGGRVPAPFSILSASTLTLDVLGSMPLLIGLALWVRRMAGHPSGDRSLSIPCRAFCLL